MESASNRQVWRDNATNWINEHAAKLPETPLTRWHVARPMPEALASALLVINSAPLSYMPAELAVTLDRGIKFDWQNGSIELEIEILSDGSVEILQSKDGNAVNERTMPKPDFSLPKPDFSLLGEAFVWLERG